MPGMTAPDTGAVLDYLAGRLRPDLDPQRFADLLDTLVWCTDDNGEQILRVRRAWLLGGDRLRTVIAISMTDTFPGSNRDELVEVLGAAARRFPELRPKADAIIESWDAGGYPDSGGGVVETTETELPTAPEPTMADALGFFADHPAPSMPPVYLAEVFDDLAAMLAPDAAAELYAARDAWLAGGDEWQAAVALWMETDPAPPPDSTGPTGPGAEGETLLAALAARFPALAKRADAVLTRWSGRAEGEAPQ